MRALATAGAGAACGVAGVAFAAWANAAGAAARPMMTTEINATRFMVTSLGLSAPSITRLHLAVPVLGLGIGRTEHFEVPLAPAPRLDDLRGDHVDEDLGERPPLGVPLEVIGRLVPRETRVEHHRQEQIVAVVDDDQLAAGALQRRVVNEVLLGAVRADVALQRELARDDVLDRDLLVPAIAAVFLLASRLGDFLRVAERASYLRYRFAGHGSIVSRPAP